MNICCYCNHPTESYPDYGPPVVFKCRHCYTNFHYDYDIYNNRYLGATVFRMSHNDILYRVCLHADEIKTIFYSELAYEPIAQFNYLMDITPSNLQAAIDRILKLQIFK